MPRLFAAIWLVVAGSALANDPVSIDWQDLAPRLDTTANPYYGLSANEARMLGILVDIAEIREAGEDLNARATYGENLALTALNSVGLDGAALARQVRDFGTQLDASRIKANQTLDGHNVQLAGFVWPLTFDGTSVTEFVLVPYAGACVHTPPPPPNQLVIVRAPNGFELNGLFSAVDVIGQLSVESQTRLVNFVDGESVLSTGYSLLAENVNIL